jgi:hypothetical protein
VNALELLDRANAAGVEIYLSGDRVRLRAPKQPPDALLAELRQHKADLVAFLTSPCRRCGYRYRLHGNEGAGIYITDQFDLERARDALLMRYGDRLAVVMRA